eukprot:5133190-Pyramimonas_sp.AAC.1
MAGTLKALLLQPPQSIDDAKDEYAPLFTLAKQAVTRTVDLTCTRRCTRPSRPPTRSSVPRP